MKRTYSFIILRDLLISLVLILGISANANATLIGPLDAPQQANGSLLFPLFDPSLGTLNSIEINLASDYVFPVELYNLSWGPHTLFYQSWYEDPSGLISHDEYSTKYYYIDGSSSYINENLQLPPAIMHSDNNTFNWFEVEAAFSGNGFREMTVSAGICWHVDNSSITCTAPGLIPNMTASVSYAYISSAPVPESGTGGLLLSGLILAIFFTRRSSMNNARLAGERKESELIL